jgi:hypothetical protein
LRWNLGLGLSLIVVLGHLLLNHLGPFLSIFLLLTLGLGPDGR